MYDSVKKSAELSSSISTKYNNVKKFTSSDLNIGLQDIYFLSAFVPLSASAPVSADDAWGAPAPPSQSSPSDDPFGDAASKSNDPWGSPSNDPTGKSHSTLGTHFPVHYFSFIPQSFAQIL